MGRIVKVSWPETDYSATIELEDNLNQELCDDLWDNLPFESVQEHGMVNPNIIYCWVPTVNFSKVGYAQLHSESPVGRVSYSQGTGNKVIIKYGACTEDCPAPVLGFVPEEHHETIKKVGRIIGDHYFHEKKIYITRFERG